MPGWGPKTLGSRNFSLTKFLFERDGMTAWLRCEGRNDRICMGYYYDLCSLRCSGDQTCEGSEQVWMQTRLWLIQHHQRGRPRR